MSALVTMAGLPVLAGATPAAAAPTTPSSCVAEQPDATAASRMTGVCHSRVEILAERTEYAQVFLNPDGTRTLEQGIEPVRVRRGSGWVPVDTTLTATSAGVGPRATVLPMTFSAGGDTLVGKLRDGARELSFTWPDVLPKPVLKGSTAIYPQVLPGVDLQVSANATGFSEVLVVRDAKAAANPKLASLRFGMGAKGVTLATASGGGLVARDATGAPVFKAPAPLMWDSSEQVPGEAAQGDKTLDKPDAQPDSRGERARRAVMPVSVSDASVTLRPDTRMLRDPRTEYPVFIDPGVTGSLVNNEWTSVWSKYPSSSFWKNSTALLHGTTYGAAGAGRTEDCDGCADHIIRSLFHMDTSAVKGAVTDAKFRIKQMHAWTCSPVSNAKVWRTGSFSSSTTWNNQPTWFASKTAQTKGNRKVGAVHGCLGPGDIEFDVTDIVGPLIKEGAPVNLGLRAVDEGTLLQWKRFDPSTAKLVVQYNAKPYAATALTADNKACAVGAARPYVLRTTPTLSAHQKDPDGDQILTTDFYWWAQGGTRSESNKLTQSNGNDKTVSATIPAGKLVDGGTYVWYTKTTDTYGQSTFSGTCEFTVDMTPPNTPAGITSTDYSTTTPRGGAGIAGTFTIAPPTTKPEDALGYAWTLDSGVRIDSQVIAANADHSATLKLAPVHDGINTLRVWSKDRAGWFSTNPATFQFTVRGGSGPAAQWTFDEAAGTTTASDVTQHNNTATLGGSATRVAGRGNAGSALSLNGTTGFASTAAAPSYVNPDTGATVSVHSNASFTVTARVKLTSTTGVTGQRVAVAGNGTVNSAYTLGYSGPDNKWRFAMAGANVTNAAQFQVLSNIAPTAGKWTELAGVYDASTKKLTLYVNGALQTQTAVLTGGFDATGPVTIGKRKLNGVDDGFLNGAVDDVAIYDFIEGPNHPAFLADLAKPLQPAITVTNGTEFAQSSTATVTFDAGGDTNVTKFKYSLGDPTLTPGTTVNATVAGGTATVSIDVGTVSGQRSVYAAAIDDGNRQGPANQTQIIVKAPSVSGSVLDEVTFLPVVGATVKLQPGGYTTTTDVDGAFTFANVPNNMYSVTASFGGRCGTAGAQTFEVDGQELTLFIPLKKIKDSLGTTCTERTTTFATGSTVLPLTGDDAVTTIDLPFAFPFYGGAYRSAWVDTNGLLSFVDPAGSHPHTAGDQLIGLADPNAVIAAFWDDLVVDDAASVRTGIVGSGATQQVVVEWRNVYRKGNTAQRLSFSVTLAPDGTVTTNYDGLDNAAEQGANAVVGMESVDGADGIVYSSEEAALDNGKAIVFTPSDLAGTLETHNLSGTLTDAAGAPVAGATVKLDPSGLSTTTAANGTYTFYGLVADSYRVTSGQPGRCGVKVDSQVELSADTVRDLRYAADYRVMGYACATGASGYVAANTVVPLTGDDVETDVTLPFPVKFYGRTGTIATVSTNGWVLVGGGYLEPYWSDLAIDASASVRTQVTGSAPNRSYVIEWRNALVVGSTDRVTFELILNEDGRYSFQYGAMSTDLQKGAQATVGAEDLSNRVTDYYSNWEPALTANSSITYTPAAAGAVRGVLTEAVTTAPIAGATITLNPGNLKVTTGADGSYQFTGVTPGAYQVLASLGDNRCLGQYARAEAHKSGVDLSVDLSLDSDGDQYYDCTTATGQTYVPASTVQTAWTGDDQAWKATAPFPIKLYGESTTTPYISSNGFVSLAPEGATAAQATPIPSGTAGGAPAGAIYGFWDDWVVDSSAAIAVGTTGTAPNRRWTVEWRNVSMYGGDTVRASFEVIFDENGTITLAYSNIDPDNPIDQGAEGAVGIQNTNGTVGFQYLYAADLLANGLNIKFAPRVSAQNTISGTVTCTGTPVAGATVTAAGLSATTGADGTYQIAGVAPRTWTVAATIAGGACPGTMTRPVSVTRATPVANFAAQPPGTGYKLTETAVTYTALPASANLFTGYDTSRAVTLPFPVTVYGQSTTAMSIGSDGSLEFGNAYLDAFRADWEADASSMIMGGVRGTAPNRQYVVEWRSVRHHNDPSTRYTFQAILNEAGGFSLTYPTNDGTFLQAGGMSAIGLQNKDGVTALPYSDRLAVLRPGVGLRIDPTA
ncbi:carboxypeptidase regulatory-like domain-containing protein [Krasilnikovia sp. MM14-A1259]|uniref:carboxypeptidase regulatory-like domain-containing protein n=1 Tax=Krasilnikovia sp. MM14-A1259 TaxID=3373539 RepID=UPI0037F5401E